MKCKQINAWHEVGISAWPTFVVSQLPGTILQSETHLTANFMRVSDLIETGEPFDSTMARLRAHKHLEIIKRRAKRRAGACVDALNVWEAFTQLETKCYVGEVAHASALRWCQSDSMLPCHSNSNAVRESRVR